MPSELPIQVEDSDILLHADPTKVLVRPFDLAWDSQDDEPSRTERLIAQVRALPAETVISELERVHRDFSGRHDRVRDIFLRRSADIIERADPSAKLSAPMAELLGSYFCQEYSYASAAVTNPSVTLHPDQGDLQDGEQRVLIAMRTVGEGHISSIAFREGIVSDCGTFTLRSDPNISTAVNFRRGAHDDPGSGITVTRAAGCDLSETVIFPMTPTQAGGLEDLRLTRMVQDDGTFAWMGTYTAYSGYDIQSEMMITKDFRHFDMIPMRGDAARNKGMALFPRKIDGNYAMIARQDGENLYFITSPDPLEWSEGVQILQPKFPWELVQIGNCGPPIELDEGWLVLTHGVGAMRRYAIGAALLDKNDPSRVRGRTARPILSAAEEQRDGYVPNVVYSCGAMRCGSKLFLPYGIADSSVGFAFVDLQGVLDLME
ncbi:MAG: glycoside hydrolase family 130 protein [Pontixanthobacter sp.]